MALRPFWPRPHPSPGLIALGVVSLTFSVLGLFGLVVALVQGLAPASPANPLGAIYSDPSVGRAFLFFAVLGGPLSIALGAAGIGLLRRRAWARRLTLIWATVQIPLAVSSSLLTTLYLVPRMEASMPAQTPVPLPFQHGINVASTVGGMLFAIAYPILLLVLLNRDGFRRQFDPPWDAAPPAWPPEAWLGIPPSGRATAAAACGIAGIALDVVCCCFSGYLAGIACGAAAFLYGTLEREDILAGIAPVAGLERANLGRVCGPIGFGLGILIGLLMIALAVVGLFASRFAWLH